MNIKKIFKLFVAGLATSLALVSCAKQDVIENGSTNPAGGARTITVSFANSSTRSTLDGFQPKFVDDDKIKVSNGTDVPEECAVIVDGRGNATITTELTGALTMVYPAAAAKMNGNDIEGILVPSVQDGTFASANICTATIAEGATEATFENQTAVFKITPGAEEGTKYVEVITAGAEIANSVPAGSEYDTMHKIHVASASAAPVYVSILVPEGLKFRDLSFADGSNMKTLKYDNENIKVSTLYAVTDENWNIPYVDFIIPVGEDKFKTYKWATVNVGASSPEEYGEYFAWGEISGHEAANSGDGAFKSDFESFDHDDERYNDNWNISKGFSYINAPFQTQYPVDYSNNKYKKYLGDISSPYMDPSAEEDALKRVLDREDDAANVIWGGSWHVPTVAEFEVLCYNTQQEWTNDYDGSNVSGCILTDTENPTKSIFLPAAGWGDGLTLYQKGGSGCYWSSSLFTDIPTDACYVGFDESSFQVEGNSIRILGYSIRAISE